MTPSLQVADATIFWRRRARWTALRHNFGYVLGGFLPGSLAVSAAFACALLVARQHGAVSEALWITYGLSLLVCAGFAAWLVSRRGFFTIANALVRLEWHLGLHNRLSAAAAAGVGTFPPPPARARRVRFSLAKNSAAPRWRGRRSCWPLRRCP